MARRLLSHFLISLAIFSLTGMFFMWFIDGVLLNPNRLVPALKDAGALSAIATILPEKATQDAKPEDRAEMKAKIASVVTPEYVEKKLTEATITITSFMRNGNPQPNLDIKDFPDQLRKKGVDVGSDISKNFDQPIVLNKDGNLNKVPQAYKIFKIVKYFGLLFFAALLFTEWLVAEKGKKLKRLGRIFMYTSIWFFTYWLTIMFFPVKAAPIVKSKINDATISPLVDAIIKAIQKLFGSYILSFAIVCGIIALTLYLLRHFRKHVDKIEEVPTSRIRDKRMVTKLSNR